MSTPQGIKVQRDELIKTIEKRRLALHAAHEARLSQYQVDLIIALEKVRDTFSDALAALDNQEVPEFDESWQARGGKLSISVTYNVPSKPLPPNCAQLDKDLALLKLSYDEVIIVKTDSNWADYLG